MLQSLFFFYFSLKKHIIIVVEKGKERMNHMNWKEISSQKGLTEAFIVENEERVYWDCISLNDTPYSEDFMRTYKEKLHWRSVSKLQVLSEDFIREMKHVVEWTEIAKSQVISYEFILEHFHFLENSYLRKNQKLYFTEAQWSTLQMYEYAYDISFIEKKAEGNVTQYEVYFNPDMFTIASQFDKIECSVVKDEFHEVCTAQLYGIKKDADHATVIRAKEFLPEFVYKACFKRIRLFMQGRKLFF